MVGFGLYMFYVALLILLVVMIVSGYRHDKRKHTLGVEEAVGVTEHLMSNGNKSCINKKQRLYFNRKLK